ncbi:hypothetical protein HMPREF1868_00484 [Olsenella sp. DNF00959]|nr:hypothetical protein HMPREF1868_00484 [Olsenella sp. DNF00959]
MNAFGSPILTLGEKRCLIGSHIELSRDLRLILQSQRIKRDGLRLLVETYDSHALRSMRARLPNWLLTKVRRLDIGAGPVEKTCFRACRCAG